MNDKNLTVMDDDAKKCVICGDKAIGVNFNVRTCESCKVFFRRNALHYEKFKCLFDNNCVIDVLRRKFCKKCRLKKCLALGMKKEWILTEEERKARKLKIEENRKKRKESSNSESICDSTSDLNDTYHNFKKISNDNFEDLYANNLRISAEVIKTENYIKDNEVPVISNQVYYKVLEFEMSANPILRPLNDQHIGFTEVESNRIEELTRAARTAVEAPYQKVTNEYERSVIEAFRNNTYTGDDIDKLMAIYLEQMVQKTIKFSHNINAFMSLNENDQLALIKYGCIEICSIRSVRYFNFDHEYWNLVADDENTFMFKLELLKSYGKDTYWDHKDFLTKIRYEWDSDNVIIDLLAGIALFNPDRPTVTNRELIKLQNYVYMYLLERYLLIKYGSESEAKTKFLRLMNCLTRLYALNDKIVRNWSQTDPYRLMPLMSEICDRNITGSNPS